MTATGRNIAQMTWTEVRDLDKADAALAWISTEADSPNI